MPPYSVCHQTAILPRVHFHTGGSVRCQLKPGQQSTQKTPDGTNATQGQNTQEVEKNSPRSQGGAVVQKGQSDLQLKDVPQRHSQLESSAGRHISRTHSPQPTALSGVGQTLPRVPSPNPQTVITHSTPPHSQGQGAQSPHGHSQTIHSHPPSQVHSHQSQVHSHPLQSHNQPSSQSHSQTIHTQPSSSSYSVSHHPTQPKYSTFHPPHHHNLPNRLPQQQKRPSQQRQSHQQNVRDVPPSQRQGFSTVSHPSSYQGRHLPSQPPTSSASGQPIRQPPTSQAGHLPSTSKGHPTEGGLKPYTLPEKDLEVSPYA